MIKTLKNALKVKEIRVKLLFTLAMLVVVRLGSQIPVPGIDPEVIRDALKSLIGDSFNFLDAFTGGSFATMSVFALNITPYITSSIIMQLLTIAIPKLEEMQNDGEDGRKKIAAITRYVTVALALIESAAMAYTFGVNEYYTYNGPINYVVVIAGLTAGSAVVMWIGERITEKGIGNGISIVLLINILARIPADFKGLFETFVFGANSVSLGVVAAIVIIAVVLLTVVLTVILDGAVRKIPVQYSQKMQGRRLVGAQGSNIPLKVNTSGVIPIIFASSILQFPLVLNNFFGWWTDGVGAKVMMCLNQNNWCDFTTGSTAIRSIGLLVYILLVVFFAYFYTAVTFNPLEIANNMKKQGGFIPGIRPGKPTSDYLNAILKYIIFIGACGLIIVAVIPIAMNGIFGANVSFGGTSLLIIVSVVLETMNQIESMMLVRNYKGFLND